MNWNFLLLFLASCQAFEPLLKFRDLITRNHLKVSTVFHCNNLNFKGKKRISRRKSLQQVLTDLLELNAAQMNLGRSLQVLNLEDDSEVEEFLRFKPFHTNVFLNAHCAGSLELLLEKMSELKLINESRRLFVHGNQSIRILGNQNINLDSEVLVFGEDGDYQVKSLERWRGSKVHVSKIEETEVKSKNYDLERMVLFVTFTVSQVS